MRLDPAPTAALRRGDSPAAALLEAGAAIGAGTRTGAAAGHRFVGGMAAAMGLTVCRPGRKYCRPRLKQPGRRQLERRVRMQSIKAEYLELQDVMRRAVQEIALDLPPAFHFAAEKIVGNLATIAKMYIHDYDDNEICVDTGMCDAKELKIPRAPYIWPWFPYP
jgi:hypothetical protein